MRTRIAYLAATLLISTIALCQQVTAPKAATSGLRKAVMLSGTVSDDGQMFVCDGDNSVWKVENPESAKGYEGQSIRLQGFLMPETSQMHILVVKRDKRPNQYVTQMTDSAFRR